jgi:hypothetical protein
LASYKKDWLAPDPDAYTVHRKTATFKGEKQLNTFRIIAQKMRYSKTEPLDISGVIFLSCSLRMANGHA